MMMVFLDRPPPPPTSELASGIYVEKKNGWSRAVGE